MASKNKDSLSALKKKDVLLLKASLLNTQLGLMMAVADECNLYLLEFTDWKGLESQVKRLQKQLYASIEPGRTRVIDSIENELTQYYNGQLQGFKTPYVLVGSLFEKSVWQELQKIPYGQTRSYAQVAVSLGKPLACRAVARANSVNKLAVLIPCHRVINSNGQLGGYASGLDRKKWLLDNEGLRI